MGVRAGGQPSVASTGTPITARARSRLAKKKPGMLSESLEDDGHLPGYKDGVGVFPPDSDFAEVMLSLKLKGTCHRSLVCTHTLLTLVQANVTERRRSVAGHLTTLMVQ